MLRQEFTLEMENRIQEKTDNDAMLNGYQLIIGALCARAISEYWNRQCLFQHVEFYPAAEKRICQVSVHRYDTGKYA